MRNIILEISSADVYYGDSKKRMGLTLSRASMHLRTTIRYNKILCNKTAKQLIVNFTIEKQK